MSYTVLQLVTNAFYTSGVVARDYQTVQGSQLLDGLQFLNDVITDKTVETDMIPYYSQYDFFAVQGQESYFVPNLIELQTLVFFIDNIRYEMQQLQRNKYFGSSRANNIQSLPFTYHVERLPLGAKIFLYFLPQSNFHMQGWGLFRLTNVNINQDLNTSLTTVNLGVVTIGGLGTLNPGELVINATDLAGNYASIAALTLQINNTVPGVNAFIFLNTITLQSAVNITLTTLGTQPLPNFVTFQYFSTQAGALNQTYYPLQLDQFYLSYLKYALAVRICNEFNYDVPPGVAKQLTKYETMISKRSQQIDLRNVKISTLDSTNTINYAQINLGRGWDI